MMVSAMFGHRINERAFFPRFVRACGKGLISVEGWEDLAKHRLARKVVALPKSVEAIREVQIILGGDYSYYKYFDPYENYEKHPEKMDRFLKGPVKGRGGQKPINKKELFKAQFEAHKKDPGKYRWF
jgi:hypothetical protein